MLSCNNTTIDHKMADAHLKHKKFDELQYMRHFYYSLSYSCHSFVASGTKGIVNYASYVYSAIEGTLASISTILSKGRINDAYAMIRKLFDDIVHSNRFHLMLLNCNTLYLERGRLSIS